MNSTQSSISSSSMPIQPKIFFGSLIVIIGTFVSIFVYEMWGWVSAKPEIVVLKKDWSYIRHTEAKLLCEGLGTDPFCLRNPANFKRWKGQRNWHGLIDDERSAQVDGKIYLGLELDDLTTLKMLESKAIHLILGPIKGDGKVWVNQDLFFDIPRNSHFQGMLEFPQSFLKEKKTLFILLEIEPLKNARYTLGLTEDGKSGFYHQTMAMQFSRMSHYWRQSKGLLFFTLFLACSIFCFFYWSTDKNKEHLYYFSLYFLGMGAIEFITTSWFSMNVQPQWTNVIVSCLRLVVANLLILIGLSFSMMLRRSLIRGMVVKMMIPSSLLAAIAFQMQPHSYIGILRDFLLPLTYITSALIGLYKFRSMTRLKQLSGPKQRFSLIFFSLGMLLISSLHLMIFLDVVDFFWKVVAIHFFYAYIICFIASLIFLDIKRLQETVLNVPVSKYHKQGIGELSPVKGLVFSFDLKQSEILFRQQVSSGNSLTEEVLAKMLAILLKHEVTIVRTDGDGGVFFLEQTGHLLRPDDLIKKMVRVIDELNQTLGQCAHHFSLNLGVNHPLHYRLSMALGTIRPIWQGSGQQRMAAWDEVGDEHPLLVCARLLEIEKNFDPQKSKKTVIFPHQLFGYVHGERGLQAVIEKIDVLDKNQRTYTISLFEAGSALCWVKANALA